MISLQFTNKRSQPAALTSEIERKMCQNLGKIEHTMLSLIEDCLRDIKTCLGYWMTLWVGKHMRGNSRYLDQISPYREFHHVGTWFTACESLEPQISTSLPLFAPQQNGTCLDQNVPREASKILEEPTSKGPACRWSISKKASTVFKLAFFFLSCFFSTTVGPFWVLHSLPPRPSFPLEPPLKKHITMPTKFFPTTYPQV